MKRRWVIGVVLACVVAGIVVAMVWPREREPEYGGKRLSEWLVRYRGNASERTEAVEAVLHIGTNAEPWLMKWMDYEDMPRWKMRLFGAMQKLPQTVRPKLVVRRGSFWQRNGHDYVAAVDGFEILGPAAKGMIPELARMMRDPTPDGKGRRAIFALTRFGEDAIPALMSALSDPRQPNRWTIADSVGRLERLGTNANPVVPVLIRCLKDGDERVAEAAGKTLGRLALEPELAIPALTEALRDPRLFVRVTAAVSIGKFGERGAPAEASLRQAMTDSDDMTREAATNALRRVEGKLDPNPFE